jgi:hypothetical protein
LFDSATIKGSGTIGNTVQAPSPLFYNSAVFSASDSFQSSSEFVNSSPLTESSGFGGSPTFGARDDRQESTSRTPFSVGIGAGIGVLALIAVVIILILYWKNRKEESDNGVEIDREDPVGELSEMDTEFTMEEVFEMEPEFFNPIVASEDVFDTIPDPWSDQTPLE